MVKYILTTLSRSWRKTGLLDSGSILVTEGVLKNKPHCTISPLKSRSKTYESYKNHFEHLKGHFHEKSSTTRPPLTRVKKDPTESSFSPSDRSSGFSLGYRSRPNINLNSHWKKNNSRLIINFLKITYINLQIMDIKKRDHLIKMRIVSLFSLEAEYGFCKFHCDQWQLA